MDVLRLAAKIPPRIVTPMHLLPQPVPDSVFILAMMKENRKNPSESFSIRKMIADSSLKDTRVHC